MFGVWEEASGVGGEVWAVSASECVFGTGGDGGGKGIFGGWGGEVWILIWVEWVWGWGLGNGDREMI